MEFLGLISGGKDSIYTICKLIDEGYTLKALLYISCESDMIDSYMYQTVGKEIINEYETCLNVPLFIHNSKCVTVNKNLEYTKTVDDEVEDLYGGIKCALSKIYFQYVSSGAIASIYQKNRVENVCKRLGLNSLAPLFGLDQKKLLNEMIDYGIDAIVVKVATSDLSRSAINKNLTYIKEFYDKCGYDDANYCGEGGEYETMVLNTPHFKQKIEIQDHEICGHPEEEGKKENVFFLKFKQNLKLPQ